MLQTLSWTAEPIDPRWEDGPQGFTYLPQQGEEAFLLTSHFGRFHAEVLEGGERQRLRSRIAFSWRKAPGVTPEAAVTWNPGARPAPQPGGIPPAAEADPQSPPAREVWVCRITRAIDIQSNRPLRLVWALDANGTLVTFLNPTPDGADHSTWHIPRLIPVSRVILPMVKKLHK